MAASCHIVRPDLTWLTECGRESQGLNAEESDIDRRWCVTCKKAHETRPVSELNPACSGCSKPLARVKKLGRGSQLKCVQCGYSAGKSELTAVIPRGTNGSPERPGRVRSRHSYEMAKNYVMHVQMRSDTTFCNKPVKDMDCYPLQADREQCIEEDQCCQSCAMVIYASMRRAQGPFRNRRVEFIHRSTAYALSMRAKVIDAVASVQEANGRPVRTDEVLTPLGADMATRTKKAWGRVLTLVAASGADEIGRRLIFAGRTTRGYTWRVAEI